MSRRRYHTFDFPANLTNDNGQGKTLLTGIRQVRGHKKKVYISGFYESSLDGSITSYVYKGRENGRHGEWYVLSYPSSEGATVVATSLYGPNNGAHHGHIQVVGNYSTVESGGRAIGCLYQGPLSGVGGEWTTLIPTSLVGEDEEILNTIAHSTMGGFVVGNFDTSLKQGRAFLYRISTGAYTEILPPSSTATPNVSSITAYGIWHNDASHTWTIAGGFSEVGEGQGGAPGSGLDQGYLMDWNGHVFFHFQAYTAPHASISHFDGISGVRRLKKKECRQTLGIQNHGCYKGNCAPCHHQGYTTEYTLTGDLVSRGKEEAFFATVKRKHSKRSRFSSRARWQTVEFPGAQHTSGNSVLGHTVIGVYQESDDGQVHGYLAKL